MHPSFDQSVTITDHLVVMFCIVVIGQVFGERGVHSRSAVGTNALPMNVPVEIEAIVEFDDSRKKGDDDWTVLKRP